MKTVGIVPNYGKETAMQMVAGLAEFLKGKECRPVVTYKTAEMLGLNELGVTKYELYSKSDFIIVLGGDGTLLDTGRKAAKFGTPLLGINMGTMGFLAAADGADANETIEKVLNGEYKIEKRLMLESEIISETDSPKQYRAINDVCITRGVFTKITEYKIYVNDEYLATFRADGIIADGLNGVQSFGGRPGAQAGHRVYGYHSHMPALAPFEEHSRFGRRYRKDRGQLWLQRRHNNVYGRADQRNTQ